MTSDVKKSKEEQAKQETPEKKEKLILNVTGHRPLSNSYLNTFYRLFSKEQIMFFEGLYLDLKDKLDRLNITGEEFMKYAKDAYQRYQTYKKIDPLHPMDKKAQKYVTKFLRKTVEAAFNDSKKVKENDLIQN